MRDTLFLSLIWKDTMLALGEKLNWAVRENFLWEEKETVWTNTVSSERWRKMEDGDNVLPSSSLVGIRPGGHARKVPDFWRNSKQIGCRDRSVWTQSQQALRFLQEKEEQTPDREITERTGVVAGCSGERRFARKSKKNEELRRVA
jgi:hypothetical protein